MTQTKLANALGIHHTYLSAILHGRKGLPNENLVRDIAKHLELSTAECVLLEQAARVSFRQLSLPETANLDERKLVGQLIGQIGRLLPAQIFAIKNVLELTPGVRHTAGR